jgi:hypothetical protein
MSRAARQVLVPSAKLFAVTFFSATIPIGFLHSLIAAAAYGFAQHPSFMWAFVAIGCSTSRPWCGEPLLARKRAFFSVGRKEGRYARAGRLVLWWYGFRHDSELCAVWWLDRKHRNATNGLTVKPPWCQPLYSEDYGKHRPYLRLFGWRVLSVKYDR